MTRIRIEVKGVRETIQNINEFGKEADRQLGLAMAKVVFKITKDAKGFAPVKTGFLRANIIPNVQLRGKSNIKGTITSKAIYSAAQEFGTSTGIIGKRFMRRALSSNIAFAERTLGDALNRATLRSRVK